MSQNVKNRWFRGYVASESCGDSVIIIVIIIIIIIIIRLASVQRPLRRASASSGMHGLFNK